MTIRVDPEEHEIQALFALADVAGWEVLEIGCGDGRLTWRYAGAAGRVTAIDPYAEGIARAKEDLPAEWRGRVEFQQAAFEDFAASSPGAIYDLVILSWSLC
jgi:2-polyprenyl-3-methyl-5-hydroxy-6-metoxy-1,4-benzoquinol methylase